MKTMTIKKVLNKKGFTLVELMVVVAIIGIISLIAYPSFSQIQSAATAHEDVNSIASFVKKSRIWAFTHKEDVTVKLSGSGLGNMTISATWNNNGTEENIQEPVTLKRAFKIDGFIGADGKTKKDLSINRRGIINVEEHPTNDSLFKDNFFYLDAPNNQARNQDCVAIDRTGVFLGVYDNGVCNANKTL